MDYTLSKGSHTNPKDGRCAMEWVAYVAGEDHSDHPVCVSPVLQAFCIPFNDSLDTETRQRLRPYLARCIGTAGDGLDEDRAWMATDWLIREFTPAWLDLAGLHDHACNLRSLGSVLSAETLKSARPTLDRAGKASAAAGAAARDAAGGAAWDAAGGAAGAAARDAAGAAAAAAAWDAAWAAAAAAAWDAAGAAAWAAAWAAPGAAAWAAAWAAAKDALRPTVVALQDSAFDLLDRMLPTEIVELPELVRERAVEVLSAA
jgi:hypothetical protein